MNVTDCQEMAGSDLNHTYNDKSSGDGLVSNECSTTSHPYDIKRKPSPAHSLEDKESELEHTDSSSVTEWVELSLPTISHIE